MVLEGLDAQALETERLTSNLTAAISNHMLSEPGAEESFFNPMKGTQKHQEINNLIVMRDYMTSSELTTLTMVGVFPTSIESCNAVCGSPQLMWQKKKNWI